MTAPDGLGDRDALLEQAREQRGRNRLPEALATLARLEALHPQFSRLHQERGQCFVLLRDAPRAIAALHEAVRLNPTLPASWDMLEQLYRMGGDTAQAATAAQHLATLRQLPAAIVAANSLIADGAAAPAEAILRDYLHKDAGNVGAQRLLARLCSDRGAIEEAEALLRAMLDRAPDYDAARLDYAMLLLHQQKHCAARQEAEHLLRHDSENRAYLKLYGAACVGLGDHEAVIDLYARLLADPPKSATEIAELRLWRANALKIVGRRDEAIANYHAALAARSDYGVAWFGLANLKTYRFSDTEVARLRAAEAAPDVAELDCIYLCFALGKALEDRADFAESWAYYARGNALRRRTSRYRPHAAHACAQRMTQTLTVDFFAARAGWGVADPAPIFLVGLPRSGSTLIEQILASHSHVEGTQELTEISRYAAELCGSDPESGLPLHAEALERLTAADASALGARFLSDTGAYRRTDRPFFIDKMPNNFWQIGLIHLILPNATIIDVRREPLACGFSNFKQLFGTTNQEFSYGLDDIAHYYRAYRDMMRHWDAVLPGRVLRLRYEDVVDDLNTSVRRLLAHGGLAFEPACIAFYTTERSVRTSSSEQVRQPIGRDGLTQWRHYAPWLGRLRDTLGDAVTDDRS
ncbi:sulfotransferase [Sphingomonas sp.]|uniref:sulfotransferase n=1 Tax=Sphingomonas sp. TaxID=28214 RepID=UPI00333F1F04